VRATGVRFGRLILSRRCRGESLPDCDLGWNRKIRPVPVRRLAIWLLVLIATGLAARETARAWLRSDQWAGGRAGGEHHEADLGRWGRVLDSVERLSAPREAVVIFERPDFDDGLRCKAMQSILYDRRFLIVVPEVPRHMTGVVWSSLGEALEQVRESCLVVDARGDLRPGTAAWTCLEAWDTISLWRYASKH
jgi:hypothetical protein